MMESIPRLPDTHLAQAKKIVAELRQVKRCRNCYDRGYVGTNQDNMLIPCSRCVDSDAVMVAWRAYAQETPELVELYGDYFEADEESEKGSEEQTDGEAEARSDVEAATESDVEPEAGSDVEVATGSDVEPEAESDEEAEADSEAADTPS
jgi:hypothetical protein